MHAAFVLFIFIMGAAGSANALEPLKTKAGQVFLMEASTGTVLIDKDSDKIIPPASLAKLMTTEYIFHLLKTGKLTLDTTFPVSEYAWRTGGALSRTSTMFAAWRSEIRVEDLLKGIIVQSANDGCIILAEGIAGSEEAFADLLTARAKEIGFSHLTFGNSNGLPNPENLVTIRELTLLAKHIHDTYPEFFRYYSIPEFTWNNIRQRNRNPLLGYLDGVDGMKTGYTEESGYAIISTVERNGVRLYLGMSGLETEDDRKKQAAAALEWGLDNFKSRKVFQPGEVVTSVSVYGGAQSSVPVAAKQPVSIFEQKIDPDRVNAKVAYDWPLKAPVSKGQQVATLRLYKDETLVNETPLYAQQDIGQGDLKGRAFDAIIELLFFWI
ncbi:serine hydrolase [Rhizobium sp. L1K21]|uniref:D-alanyl-D-alanine carboxypeptidase family protein n=1 Tax=Rhizobium sp. L1K21 TaxID=2954933 RepID=UPI00209261AB|nr:D-alanyl-D-alanine carboxypeptidase [Rhizobium sp. L1K21]